MTTTMKHLHESYLQHPGFKFGQNEWTVDPSLVQDFNQSFKLIQYLHVLISPKAFESAKSRCTEFLSRIFHDLSEQTQDSHEKAFIEELKSESLRVFSVEAETYWSSRFKNQVDFTNQEQENNAVNLRENRYYFSRIPQSAVSEINELGKTDLARFQENVKAGRLTREDLTANGGQVVQDIRHILNREFYASGVIDAVSSYMGKSMMVTGVAYELSVSQADWWGNKIPNLPRAPETLSSHLDETIKHPKSIVYLTDVDRDTGPTSCYPGLLEDLAIHPLQEIMGRVVSNVGTSKTSPLFNYYKKTYYQSTSSENFRRHFMKLPKELRFNSHFGWDIFPGSEIENIMLSKEVHMTGPAGTFIVFDGAKLFHRGGLVKKGHRVALQVVFGDLSWKHQVKRTALRWKKNPA